MTKRPLNVPTHLQHMQAQWDRERALRRAASASWRARCKAASRAATASWRAWVTQNAQSPVLSSDNRPVWHCPHCERPEDQLPVRNGRSWGLVPDARGQSQRVCLDCVDAFDASVRVQKFCEVPLDGPIH